MPTRNAGPLLDEVLAGIEAQQAVRFDELHAVDTESTDGTVERLLRHGFTVDPIRRREFDHGGTRDRGIARTTGDIIVLMVQDATPQGTDWLQQMLVPFEDPNVVGVWCKQIPRPTCQPVLARRLAGWPGWGTGVTVQKLEPGQQLTDLPQFDRLMRCAFDNVASAIRRTAWQRFPLGPRRFGEDVWFSQRVITSGLSLAFQGSAVVMHSHDRTPWQEGKRTFCDHRNLRRTFGLETIPDRQVLRDSIKNGIEEHLAYVRSLSLPKDQEPQVLRWSADFVRWQCWAQYLGAKAGSDPKGMKGVFFRWLGRRLERGIG